MAYGTAAIDTINTSGNLTVTGNVIVSGNSDLFVSGSQVEPLVLGTAQASTSGASIDFTSIPSWVKRITVMFSGVSTNGSSNWLVQLGTASGVENTGYLGVGTFLGATVAGSNYTAGFGLQVSGSTHVMQGQIILSLLSSSTNTWTCLGSLGGSGGGAGYIYSTCGAKSLAATLDRVRLTTVNGTDAFDAGSVNIMYE